MSRADERKFAKELGVMDASDLIKAKYPAILGALTPPQIDQVQRQLDADIINASLDRQREDHDRKSIVGRTSTGRAVHDPGKAAAPFRARMAKIVLKDADTLIRVDAQKLLLPGAFVPTSDNPDEAAYLLQVKAALATQGVWLRFFPNASQMAHSQYARNDHRRWFVNLWLGSDPRNEIKSPTGQLNRQVLLAVPTLGKDYYHYVHNGRTLKFLRHATEAVRSKINVARQLHDDWDPAHGEIRTRLLEWGIVNGVGNGMLGLNVKYPSKDIWKDPLQTLDLARKMEAAGEITEATKLTAFAAFQAEWCARAVVEYANFINSTKGAAGFVLKILQVLDDLGRIADMILLVRQLGKSIIRRVAGAGSGAAEQASKAVVTPSVSEPVPKYHGREAHAPTHYPGFQEEKVAYEITVDKANATIDSGIGRIASGDRYEVANWDKLVAKHEELSREIRAYQKKHGGGVPIQMLNEMSDRLDRKYGFSTLKERMGGK
jgi:hypothetical protein